MALKTNYKDDIFSGNRKYNMISNGDGTVSLIDMTTYSQTGDAFGGSDINATNQEVNNHEKDYTLQVPYAGTTGGTANTYTISSPTITTLTAGMAVCVKFHVASTAASTLNWCSLGAKGIKKSNGNDATNLKVGVYTLRYDGTNFILQGEGGSGNASASDLLSGKTATTDAGDITGSMANNGAVNQTLAVNGNYTIPAGYHNGSGKVTQSIPTKAAAIITPGTTDQTIPAGQYLVGDQTISAVTGTAIPADVLAGKTFNSSSGILLTGTLANGKKFATSTAVSGGTGLAFQYAGSTTTISRGYITVSGLTFTPSFIYIKAFSGGIDCFSVYDSLSGIYAKTYKISGADYGTTGGTVMNLKADAGGAYVNSTGFQAPVWTTGLTYTWVAYE